MVALLPERSGEDQAMKSTPPIPFAGSQLGEQRHVCAFFNSADEQYDALLPFIKDGFACGHKAVHVVNPGGGKDHLQRLTAAGIDTTTTQRSGQLDLKINVEAYLEEGRFDQDRMLGVFEQLASGNDDGRYPLSRIVCQMDWAADSRSLIDNLVEFESRVNDVWHHHEDAVICVYDLAKFGGNTVIDIMRTHPMVIIGGILQSNPFYVPPEEFLREVRQRKSPRSGRATG
jgi:MEDS: MEthanogen/methylotroph, DcmR Sensory domain